MNQMSTYHNPSGVDMPLNKVNQSKANQTFKKYFMFKNSLELKY